MLTCLKNKVNASFAIAAFLVILIFVILLFVNCSPRASILKGSLIANDGGQVFTYQLVLDAKQNPLCILVLNQSLSHSNSTLAIKPVETVDYEGSLLKLKKNNVIAIYNDGIKPKNSIKIIQLTQFKKFMKNDFSVNLSELHRFLLDL